MTKTVRIENADGNQDLSVTVQSQLKDDQGNWVDCLESPVRLLSPADMTTQTLWSGKRLVIEENTQSGSLNLAQRKKTPTMVYIAGRTLPVDEHSKITGGAWEVLGVFSKSDLAELRCTQVGDFVGPAALDQSFPEHGVPWTGAYFFDPLLGRRDPLAIARAEPLPKIDAAMLTNQATDFGTFILNGNQRFIPRNPYALGYEDICELVGVSPEHTPTVTFSKLNGPQGMLLPSGVLVITDGTVINAVVTGNA